MCVCDYVHVCVSMCVCVCARACVCEYVHVCVSVAGGCWWLSGLALEAKQ